MKISLFVTQHALQFNLTPESVHEKEFMELLNKYTGKVEITSGLEVIRTQGNYLRNQESPKTVVITVNSPNKVEENE